jgi:hypothetical protein
MNRPDDNDVIVHDGTGNLLDLRIGKQDHATKIFASDVHSRVVEVRTSMLPVT